ncbi:MAG: hypothetical protein ABJB98_06890 [Actinomycetota bacterium]
MNRYVAVVGPGEGATRLEVRLADEIGQRLAENNVVVVTGGLAGVMAAAARGARRAGGQTVGLLPGLDRAAADAGVTMAIPTGLGELRNALVVNSADGLIAVGGSWGTLSEIAFARRADLPVVSVCGWTVRDHNGNQVEVSTADSAEKAVTLLLGQLPRPA